MNQIAGACLGDCGLGGLKRDAFVTKINAAGSALVYSSYVGGSGMDTGSAIALDGLGNVYVTGDASGADFPRVNQIAGACRGSCGTGLTFDVFVTKINAAGSALVYSSYLGGSGYDEGNSIAVDGFGNAYVTGATYSSDFPIVKPDPRRLPGDLRHRRRLRCLLNQDQPDGQRSCLLQLHRRK